MSRRVGVLRLALLAGLAAANGLATPARADEAARPGDRVRIEFNAAAPYTGRLLAYDRDSLAVRPDSARVTDLAALRFARASIAGLDVERDVGHPVRGAILGGLAGGAVGLLAMITFAGEEASPEAGLLVLYAAPLAGALVGSVVGSNVRSPRWKVAYLEALPAGSPDAPSPTVDAVAPSARVRVTLLQGADPASTGLAPRVVGTLLEAGPTTLRIRRAEAPHDSIAIPREIVGRFETSVGRRTRAGQGSAIGLVTGLALGVLLNRGEVDASHPFGHDIHPSVVFGVGGGIAGAVVGSIVGRRIPRDRWVGVPVGPADPSR